MRHFSGRFVLRIPPETHRLLWEKADAKGVSLNQVCLTFLKEGLLVNDDEKAEIESIMRKSIEQLIKRFKNKLIGVILFGSYADGSFTSASDVDLFVILDPEVPIIRDLYKWWDEEVKMEQGKTVNPHFVTYPAKGKKISGIWFEVVEKGVIYYQKGRLVDRLFSELKGLIEHGIVRRSSSNGHPYWVWR